jgi:tetratricopeptide (TPR) repeat protein
MQTRILSKWLRATAAAAAIIALPALVLSTDGARAMGDPPPPKPRVDCSKKANKGKAECKQLKDEMSDDEIYYGGYWLARAGKYQEALDLLRTAKTQRDPRILNYIGFVTRKLGRLDEAMGYYAKALELNPNYTVARAYLGEAFLQKGNVEKAREQLAEIEKRCGTSCTEHIELSMQIEAYERTGAYKG